MTESPSTTVLSDKTVNIPFGEFASTFIAGIIIAALAVGAFLLPVFVQAPWAFIVGWGIGGLMCFGLIFAPVSLALDVGDRIPEIKAARKTNKDLKEIDVRHPYLWAIILLNLASFWSGIGWLVALAWACSPGKVVIPDKLFNAVFLDKRNDGPEVLQKGVVATSSGSSILESELLELKQLVERGLITVEEGDARRKLILNR